MLRQALDQLFIGRVSCRASSGTSLFAISAPLTAMLAAVACWLAAEAVASVASSASCYDFIEYIRVIPVVESKRKLIQIQRQILR